MKDYVIIVPVFNAEKTIGKMIETIRDQGYLDNCLFIDDASTDRTASILSHYDIKALFLKKNGQKIGAIKTVLEKLDALPPYIVLTDGDTFFYDHGEINKAIYQAIDFMHKEGLAAIGLKAVPNNLKGLLEKCQYWEYCADRSIHNLLSKKKHMRCIPGAGGIYETAVLLEVLQLHSLKHAGDDMETTALVQRLGYKVGYYSGLEARTDVPTTFWGLIKQRIRWTTGAMETYIKERRFYVKQKGRYGFQIFYETVKIITYLGWYYALITNFVFVVMIGLFATYLLSWVLGMVNPETKGERWKFTAWMVPTAVMIYIVDFIRLPIAYIKTAWNLTPQMETTTGWVETFSLGFIKGEKQ